MARRSAVVRGLAVAGAAAPWLYLGWVRPWHLRWGATAQEAGRDLPGDDLVPHPMLEATRAVTVLAPPGRVWPWIVQMGYGRAGFYAIGLIDNAGRASARRLLPEFQHLAVGDVMPTSPLGGFTVRSMDPPRSMVMSFDVDVPGVTGSGETAMVLDPVAPGQTRLICRLRAHFAADPRSRLYYLIFEPGDFIMMRLMLKGIKERAERTTEEDLTALTA